MMRWKLRRRAASGILFAIGLTQFVSALAPAAGQDESKPKMDERTGVAVGEKAPPVRLKDQAGRERSLGEMLQEGNVALVFHRSADW